MSARSLAAALVLLSTAACASRPPATRTTSSYGSQRLAVTDEKTSIPAFTLSPENLNVDKVGMRDGTFKPDGNRDLAFEATIQGPFDALFIVSCDAKGIPVYGFRADTLIGNEEVPAELGSVIDTGKMTLNIGVWENAKWANADSGSVIVGGGVHKVKLYVPNSAGLRAGMHVRLYARAAGGLVPGPFFEY